MSADHPSRLSRSRRGRRDHTAHRAALAIIFGSLSGSCSTNARAASWAVFYGPTAPLAALRRPDLLVLEPDHDWDVRSLRRRGQRVLAYLSLGEVHRGRSYYPALAESGALLGPNPNWDGAERIAPDAPAWRQRVLDQIAPALMARGYDGLFLDTLDAAVDLEHRGVRPGAVRAMGDLVLALRERLPGAILVCNGGLGLLPHTARALTGVAVESVFTDYDFATRQYRVRPPDEAREREAWIRHKVGEHSLLVFAVEYLPPTADEGQRAALTTQVRLAGFVPFVTDILLQTLPR